MTPYDVRGVPCPECGAEVGNWCLGLPKYKSHEPRVKSARGVPCDKTTYRRRKFALGIAREQTKRAGEEIEAYRCLRCHGWHTGHAVPSTERTA